MSVEPLPSLTNYFKCPSQIFEFVVDGELTSPPGFFRLGTDTVCYGKSSTGGVSEQPRLDLFDVSENVRANGAGVILPFDPEEVARNLRQERYAKDCDHFGLSDGFIREMYYLVRPWMPLSFRKHLQRIYLRGWEKLSFPKWPVDRTVDRLFQKLLVLGLKSKGLDSIPFIWFWPEGANASAVMTHDVEAEAGKQFCSELMDIDESYGIPASFQIVPEVRYSVEPEFLDQMRSRGFEVNVQDLNHDGRLFQEKTEFERRVKAINRYAKEYRAAGFRSAVLYRNQEWFDRLEFEYDMSVPNVAHLDPQRGGCCTIMPYFVGGLVELPVTMTQDHTLFNVLSDFSTSLWEQQIQEILKQNGFMNFIVHPDYILGEEAQNAFKRLLARLAEMRKENNLWLALPREVNRWWRQRDRMTLTQKGGEWCIEGEGSERARLAFASLQDDELVYSLAESKSASALPASFAPSKHMV